MEQWKSIEGYEDKYIVSDLGNIHNIRNDYPIKSNDNGKGYKVVYLYDSEGKRKTHLVHRLVAKAFLSNPLKLPEVNHRSGDKEDNSKYNLQWCTHEDNIKHAIHLELLNMKGSKHHDAKLNEDKVRAIRILINMNFTQQTLADMFGVSRQVIGDVCRGKTWKHVL